MRKDWPKERYMEEERPGESKNKERKEKVEKQKRKKIWKTEGLPVLVFPLVRLFHSPVTAFLVV